MTDRKVIRVHPDLSPDAMAEQTARCQPRGGTKSWKCDGCGRVDLWGPSWSWYGSYAEVEDAAHGEVADAIRVACSDGCRDKALRVAPMPPQKRRRPFRG